MSGQNYRLSTHDYGAEYRREEPRSDTEYAAIEFQNMVLKASDDGRISREEAIELIERHTSLQKKSRNSLRNVLKALMIKAEYESIREDIYPSESPEKVYIYRDSFRSTHNNVITSKRKIPQKVTWLSIVGPAALVSLLGVLGVI